MFSNLTCHIHHTGTVADHNRLEQCNFIGIHIREPTPCFCVWVLLSQYTEPAIKPSAISTVKRTPETTLVCIQQLVCLHNKQPGWQAVVAREKIADVMNALYPGRDDVACRPLISSPGVVQEGNDYPGTTGDLAAEDMDSLGMRLLGEWLSFYGPLAFSVMHQKTGVEIGLLTALVEDLIDAGRCGHQGR